MPADRNEFVSAQPAHDVPRPDRLVEAAGRVDEQGVTSCVAQQIVLSLHSVNIDKCHRQFFVVVQRTLEELDGGCPIEHAGQRISARPPLEVLRGSRHISHILDGQHDARWTFGVLGQTSHTRFAGWDELTRPG